ncbi:hypothetical protein DY000_02024330 [Brassica cretica]|uniref:Uncharacterized protein n=1 Tax=Brassica cretica TaxID=69181 RepID=A0ABQ7E0W3_BRACR|nr:hypothetical protein DY000_02024330 [Brassica cretica]
MTKRPLSKHEFGQTRGAQRPPVVAPGFGSDLEGSLQDVDLGPFSCVRAMKTRATSPRRSGKVVLIRQVRATWQCRSRLRERPGGAPGFGSDLEGSLRDVAPGPFSCLQTRGRERPWCVAPTGRSEHRERLRAVALGGRSRMWCTATSCSRSRKSLQAMLVQRSL